MSLDKLAIIFFIIILPIVIVFNVYTDAQIDTLNLQLSYDNKLKNSTYDAMKAFQANTLNSSTSDLANSKIRDIEASINAFFDSLATNFDSTGYSKDTLQEYVPAIVYTMYDGYYIYSAYTNNIEESDKGYTYKPGDKLYGLKPYISYSCEYKNGENYDVTITYSLDNYITIEGKVKDNKWIYDSGYLVSNISDINSNSLKYREIEIPKNENLMEDYVIRDADDVAQPKKFPYQKINGVKYYKDGENWFSIINGEEKPTTDKFNDYDSSAYNYYYDAFKFRERLKSYGLENLSRK